MANNNSALEQLKSFLNELFQFDSQDLDFGVYKILHYKRKEIKDFIDKLLVDKVKVQLQTLTSEESKKAVQQLKDIEKDEFIQGWIIATEEEKKIGEKMAGSKVAEYRRVKTLVDEARVAEGTENQIYNHLALFFSRYYDKGDFISKRRFGKNEKYMVPYNGEETHFYWANHDQYYIKSSETFQQYAFKIPTQTDDVVVNFKLTSAQVEQGNVKADEANYFILSEKEAEIGEIETNFFFEYRPLTGEEKKTFKGNNKQDILNERAYEDLKNKYGGKIYLVKLWETDKDDKALLLKKLHHYTRKNKYDFFIHKNLKGFLQRELDYYIKSELINVDDLYVTEVDSYFDRLKHNIKTIKVFKTIADTIIEFVSQIEDFQKKLWEKKKFVLSTQWVITIDRLVEYIGEEAAKPILEEVIKNEKQVAEWKELFGEENVPKKLSVEALKADMYNWRKLPVDTVHFTKEFKTELLNKLSEKIDLEKKADGLALHSDNYHGLCLLQGKYNKRVQSIYIDPPYNTDASAILYKNNYKASSFASLMDERLKAAHDLLKTSGIICVAIDDEEVLTLRQILNSLFIKQLGIATVRSNPAGRKTKGKFAPAHEYALFYGNDLDAIPSALDISKKRLRRYPQVDEKGNFAWANFIRSGNNDRREDRPKLYYPIFVTDNNKLRVPDMIWSDEKGGYILQEVSKKNETVVYPVLKSGNRTIEKNWQRGHKRFMTELEEYRVRRPNDKLISIDFKTRMDEGSLPTTWWEMKEYASANYGASEMKAIFGENPFDFPKARKLVEDCINTSGGCQHESIIVDFFPGSGTTFHATQELNRKNKTSNKTLLIEQGQYIYSIIIPRIKKIAYTFEWKEGKPKPSASSGTGSMNGLGVFFKYQRLEQYEEALENIAFTAHKDAQQQALEFDQYIPKYMLEFETKNSQTLVNTEAMKDPWDYKLKVWDGFTYDTEQEVDLVETFNYLIGLHMQKCISKELNGKKYQFVYGHNNANKKILVVWRSVRDWKIEDYKADSEALKEELKNYTYDLLYINEQAHIEGYQPIEEVFKNKMLP